MRHRARLFLFCSVMSAIAPSIRAQAPPQKSDGWKPVETALRRSGEAQPDGAFKFSMPRRDLSVTVQGTQIKAGLALGSWAALKKMGDYGLLMGDLVLTESEVTPVVGKLQDGGIEVTAIHNHLLGESPRVIYVHIGAIGNAVKLAQSLRAALDLTKTPPAAASTGQPEEELSIDTAQIEQILGHKGKVRGGVFQITVARAKPVRLMMGAEPSGIEIPNSMGVASPLNFQPTGNGKAAISGDLVLIGEEVNPVIQALRANRIEVMAVHSHMLQDRPCLFFLHFWANNDALKLARGLRAALDKTDSARAEQK